MKRVVLALMTVLLALGWMVTGQDLIEKPLEYRKYIAEAKNYESQKIYITAIDRYKKALELNPSSMKLQLAMAEDYRLMGDEITFTNRCITLTEQNNYPEEPTVALAQYYIDKKNDEKAVKLLQKALKEHKNNKKFNELFEQVRYSYDDCMLYYDKIMDLRNDSATVIQNDQYGLISISGKRILSADKTYVSALSSEKDAISVIEDGETFITNADGYRIYVPQQDQKIDDLGTLRQGVTYARNNGKYGYIDEEFNALSPFEWDDATIITDSVGAVKKGEKWALINNKFQTTTDFKYDDIKYDDYKYCSITGRVFVKEADGYHMVDGNGKEIGADVYEDAVPFVGDEPTAVCKGGKWGFVDTDGKMVIEPQYEGARAFNGGLAPVKTASGWGYINAAGTMVIEDSFTDAKSFYKGYAPVLRGTSWTIIELYVKE